MLPVLMVIFGTVGIAAMAGVLEDRGAMAHGEEVKTEVAPATPTAGLVREPQAEPAKEEEEDEVLSLARDLERASKIMKAASEALKVKP